MGNSQKFRTLTDHEKSKNFLASALFHFLPSFKLTRRHLNLGAIEYFIGGYQGGYGCVRKLKMLVKNVKLWER